MQEIDSSAGGVSMRLRLPDGLCVPSAAMIFRPPTVEAFEAVIEACGGVEAFEFPTWESYYDVPAMCQLEGTIRLHVYPPRKVAGVDGGGRRPHPFFGEYAARKAVKP